MDAFRFILENPHPSANNNKHRKRARLVTACDSCRIKKIKCQQATPNARCEACKAAKTPCLFGDRDRYQAERGVTCSWSPTPAEDAPASPEPSSRKRKMATPPADNVVPNYRYFHPESQAGPSTLMPEYDAFPNVPSHSPPYVPSHSPPYIPSHSPAHLPSHSPSLDSLPLFDPARPRFPHPHRMRTLAPLFFDSIGPHFPFLDRADVLHRIQHSTCSAILANTLAGLAARFCPVPDHAQAASFYTMATTLAQHVASAPSIEALHALLCIAWAENAASASASAWSYSRHAIAMALDLGLGNEATIRVAASPAVRARLRLTWWTVVCLADIAPALAAGSAPVLDLDAFDTALPAVTDDLSLMRRTTVETALLRAKGARDPAEGAALTARLSPALRFSKPALLRWTSLGLGASFVGMHFALHALAILSHTSYDGAARTAAKAIVDILMAVEETGAHAALRDPFLGEALHVAARVFEAESGGGVVARQWSETFVRKCQEGLASVSRACGAGAEEAVYAGAEAEAVYPSEGAPVGSSLDLFTVPQNATWLLRPGLVDDAASDTSSSFRSSSRELSPRLKTSLGASPLVRTADADAGDMAFFEPGVFDGVDFSGMGMGAFFDESCAGAFALDQGLAVDGLAKDAKVPSVGMPWLPRAYPATS